MAKKRKVDPRDTKASRIRRLYWDYVRAVQGIGSNEQDPASRYHPLYDGERDGRGRTRRSVWLQLAEWALANDIDVEALFRNLAKLHKGGHCIAPDQIRVFRVETIQRALDTRRQQVLRDLRYHTWAELLLVAMAWLNLTQLVARAWRRGVGRNEHTRSPWRVDEPNRFGSAGFSDVDILEYVLLDHTLNLSPLFRVCLADYLYVRKVEAYYRDRAKQQYLSDPDGYDTVYGDLLPQAFRAAARAGRARWARSFGGAEC
jgi:hypothetical protein